MFAVERFSKHQTLLGLLRQRMCLGNAAELARRLGKDPTYINRLFYSKDKAGHKGIGLEIMQAANDAFGLPPGFWDMDPEKVEKDVALWMALRADDKRRNGEIVHFDENTPEEEKLSVSRYLRQKAVKMAANIEAVGAHRRVPIISWVQAGSWSEIQDNFHPGQADEWALAFDSLPGNHAFALRVVGDSMTNPVPGLRTFPEGTIIIVDPGRGADAGDFVIAKDVQTQKATFKQLATDGVRWFLRPLNPTYPTVEIDDPAMRVIGRVIEFQTRGKL
jgi:SOS-response transcriptional repressor LexA